MDPFNTSNEITFDEDNIVTLTIESRGRKSNCYITGLPFEKDVLKEHLKTLKKKFGCNGSVKNFTVDNVEMLAIHLQGQHRDKIIEYFESQSITDIVVKE